MLWSCDFPYVRREDGKDFLMELNLSEDIRENLLIKMRKHCRLRMRLEEIEQNTANFWCYNLKSKTARYTKWKIKQ